MFAAHQWPEKHRNAHLYHHVAVHLTRMLQPFHLLQGWFTKLFCLNRNPYTITSIVLTSLLTVKMIIKFIFNSCSVTLVDRLLAGHLLQSQSEQLLDRAQLVVMVAWAVSHLIYRSNPLNVHRLWQVLDDVIRQVKFKLKKVEKFIVI